MKIPYVEHVHDSIESAVESKVVAAGYLEDSARVTSIYNSKALFAHNGLTNVNLTLTMRTTDGTGSGW